jgi:tagaturonate reductase
MDLCKQNLAAIAHTSGLPIPDETIFSLPERILQFGTGVLLRGLPNYFIDKANKKNIFNGRVVMVKSTPQNDAAFFLNQDNLFTQCIRGVRHNKFITEEIINASISRLLVADKEWEAVLKCATNPQLQIIISNTTEIGISLMIDDNIEGKPPQSFPGKLLAFLTARYKVFKGSPESGMVIIPTELIDNNGAKLKSIVLELAKKNKADYDFIHWLGNANDFCNSLVDRIVPGKLSEEDARITEKKLGYTDKLMILSEVYSKWAIETAKPQTKEILSFSKADESIIITEDITKYRELKLYILNGAHSCACGLAILAGFITVKEAMQNKAFELFITQLVVHEIIPAISDNKHITVTEATVFAKQVFDRFRNPSIEHKWTSIAVQYTSKIQIRIVPVIEKFYNKTGNTPNMIALGFAAFLLFSKTTNPDIIEDDKLHLLQKIWGVAAENYALTTILQNESIWGIDLCKMGNFKNTVNTYHNQLLTKGASSFLDELIKNKPQSLL